MLESKEETAVKVLILHVPYEHRGGEDVHVDMLVSAYREIGLETALYPAHRAPQGISPIAAAKSLLPGAVAPEIEKFIQNSNADFVHLHNAFPLLGPNFFRWALKAKIKLIMTVHNHRFYCTNGLALRDGKVCKDCFGASVPWRPLAYNCNGDLKKSAYHALALGEMNAQDLYRRAVSHFIAPSPYIKNELLKWGADPSRVSVLMNPVTEDKASPSKQVLDVFYAGRLSSEKGIENLLRVVGSAPDLKFGIAGNGPLSALVSETALKLENLFYFPEMSHAEVLGQIQNSRIGILPSICNEILPTFVLENFYHGKICIVPDLESTRWLSESPWLGVKTDTSDVKAMLSKIREALSLPKSTQVTNLSEQLGEKKFRSGLKTLLGQNLPKMDIH